MDLAPKVMVSKATIPRDLAHKGPQSKGPPKAIAPKVPRDSAPPGHEREMKIAPVPKALALARKTVAVPVVQKVAVVLVDLMASPVLAQKVAGAPARKAATPVPITAVPKIAKDAAPKVAVVPAVPKDDPAQMVNPALAPKDEEVLVARKTVDLPIPKDAEALVVQKAGLVLADLKVGLVLAGQGPKAVPVLTAAEVPVAQKTVDPVQKATVVLGDLAETQAVPARMVAEDLGVRKIAVLAQTIAAPVIDPISKNKPLTPRTLFTGFPTSKTPGYSPGVFSWFSLEFPVELVNRDRPGFFQKKGPIRTLIFPSDTPLTFVAS